MRITFNATRWPFILKADERLDITSLLLLQSRRKSSDVNLTLHEPFYIQTFPCQQNTVTLAGLRAQSGNFSLMEPDFTTW